jgi:DDE family transposase
LVRRLRQAWPRVRIVLRADSGFCRPRLLAWCERHGVGYILGLAKNPRLAALAEPWLAWLADAKAGFAETGEKQRRFGEFRLRGQDMVGRTAGHCSGRARSSRHQPVGEPGRYTLCRERARLLGTQPQCV